MPPAYSKTGYLVLGRIVERVTGRSYGEEIGRRVIRPLRLRGTWMPETSPWIPGPHPHGYAPVRRDGEIRLVDFTEVNPSVMDASGELISTTRDLDRFFDALLGGLLRFALGTLRGTFRICAVAQATGSERPGAA
jgi:D-alanyl-D-alanine carboxypeptidase